MHLLHFGCSDINIDSLFYCMLQAELPDKVIVAVKKLSPQSKQVIDQIRSEVDAQKEYKHENLVELLDGYSKKDLHLMIYGYMEHTLFGNFSSHKPSLVIN